MFHIRPHDRVLEIGSGNRPRKESTVLCDRYLDDNYHRGGGADVVLDERPMVVADGHALPFKDKSFDYVIVSHVLEHVDDPHRFVAELMRVAPAGYLETPSELGEKVFGWKFHRWIVRKDHDTLVLRPRRGDSPFGDHFHAMYAHDLLFSEFVDSHYEDFYIQVEWKGVVPLRIEDDPAPEVHLNVGHKPFSTLSPLKEAGLRMTLGLVRLLLRIARTFRKR